MSNLKDVLKKSTVFSALEETDIQGLIPRFERRNLQVGDVIAAAGDSAQYFFLLEKGTILLGYEDGKSLVLDGCGDFLGMELLSVKGIYKATATVLEKGIAHAVSRDAFVSLIQGDTPGAAVIMAAWQTVLDQAGEFTKNSEDPGLPISF